MVQAILAGRKTMTRRVIDMDDLKESPDRFRSAGDSREWDVPRPAIKYDDRIWFAWELKNSNARIWIERCKYKPGDILWVRESFQDYGGSIFFKADGPEINDGPLGCANKWKPSIHMPKSACRIWLEVTDVRAERLHSITKEDAIYEGILSDEIGFKDYDKNMAEGYGDPSYDYPHVMDARVSFKSLWESINGSESWHSNPWVWVISFKIISTNGKNF